VGYLNAVTSADSSPALRDVAEQDDPVAERSAELEENLPGRRLEERLATAEDDRMYVEPVA
jgi:hypothetical protein